jgi:hypothetical protein
LAQLLGPELAALAEGGCMTRARRPSYPARLEEAMSALEFVRFVLLARGPVESYDEALARLESANANARELAEAAHELRCGRMAAIRREACAAAQRSAA